MTPLQLAGMAFPELNFTGFIVDTHVWSGARHALYIIRSFYVSLGESSPDPGWYCFSLTDDGSVTMVRPPSGGPRVPVGYFSESETDAREWVKS